MKNLTKFFYLFFIFAGAFYGLSSPLLAQSQNPPKKDDDSLSLTEMRSKWRIKAEEKRYEELVARGAETAKLSEELNTSFTQNRRLSRQDAEKLVRLEKLSKKILEALGGDDDDHDGKDPEEYKDETPKNLEEAFKRLAEISTALHEDLKKRTRHSISAQAISDTNDLRQLIVYIRQNGNIQTFLRQQK